ncbi:hypothetical protein KF840_18810 [bacterium]|nr:hypothetical protein [bacterium]
MGNQNAWKHGEYSAAAVVQRQAARALLGYFRRGMPPAPGVDVEALRATARRGRP